MLYCCNTGFTYYDDVDGDVNVCGNRWSHRLGTRLESAKSRTFMSLPTATTSSCAWNYIASGERHFVSWRTNVIITSIVRPCRGCICHDCLPLKSLRIWRRYTIGDLRCRSPLTSIVMPSSWNSLMGIHCKIHGSYVRNFVKFVDVLQ